MTILDFCQTIEGTACVAALLDHGRYFKGVFYADQIVLDTREGMFRLSQQYQHEYIDYEPASEFVIDTSRANEPYCFTVMMDGIRATRAELFSSLDIKPVPISNVDRILLRDPGKERNFLLGFVQFMGASPMFITEDPDAIHGILNESIRFKRK